jgi:hypothetical protein
MRHRAAVLHALACLTLFGSAGACTLRDGNARFVVPEPAQPAAVGKVGSCYPRATGVSVASSDGPVDCAGPHRAETFSVGTFADEHASGVTVPPQGSPAMRWAFDACDAEGKRFVGGDWRRARLSIQVVMPSLDDWKAGSHWYRCDIFEVGELDGSTASMRWDEYAVARTGSLRDALAGRSPLAHTCFNRGELRNLRPVSCDKRHRYEFAGIWPAPELRYADLDSEEVFHGCRSVIGAFLGVSKKVDMKAYVGVTYHPPSRAAWDRGDRGIRCFLWSNDRDLTRSVKGRGLRALA